jgi:hypothetical protein
MTKDGRIRSRAPPPRSVATSTRVPPCARPARRAGPPRATRTRSFPSTRRRAALSRRRCGAPKCSGRRSSSMVACRDPIARATCAPRRSLHLCNSANSASDCPSMVASARTYCVSVRGYVSRQRSEPVSWDADDAACVSRSSTRDDAPLDQVAQMTKREQSRQTRHVEDILHARRAVEQREQETADVVQGECLQLLARDGANRMVASEPMTATHLRSSALRHSVVSLAASGWSGARSTSCARRKSACSSSPSSCRRRAWSMVDSPVVTDAAARCRISESRAKASGSNAGTRVGRLSRSCASFAASRGLSSVVRSSPQLSPTAPSWRRRRRSLSTLPTLDERGGIVVGLGRCQGVRPARGRPAANLSSRRRRGVASRRLEGSPARRATPLDEQLTVRAAGPRQPPSVARADERVVGLRLRRQHPTIHARLLLAHASPEVFHERNERRMDRRAPSAHRPRGRGGRRGDVGGKRGSGGGFGADNGFSGSNQSSCTGMVDRVRGVGALPLGATGDGALAGFLGSEPVFLLGLSFIPRRAPVG